MRFLIKSISVILVFFMSLNIFLPKEKIYNLVEKKLLSKSIIISNESRKENLFGLEINDAEVYYDSLDTAFIRKIDFKSFIFFLKLEIDDLRISKKFENMIPSKIDKVDFTYSILNFNKVDFKAYGVFGKFKGEVNVFNKKITGELIPTDVVKLKYSDLLEQFKFIDGKYLYEFNF